MTTAVKLHIHDAQPAFHWLATAMLALAVAALPARFARASDHLDSPATAANAQADISDVYAWMAPQGRRLNLVMTMLGHSFL